MTSIKVLTTTLKVNIVYQLKLKRSENMYQQRKISRVFILGHKTLNVTNFPLVSLLPSMLKSVLHVMRKTWHNVL